VIGWRALTKVAQEAEIISLHGNASRDEHAPGDSFGVEPNALHERHVLLTIGRCLRPMHEAREGGVVVLRGLSGLVGRLRRSHRCFWSRVSCIGCSGVFAVPTLQGFKKPSSRVLAAAVGVM
jgi:hypothetical protein